MNNIGPKCTHAALARFLSAQGMGIPSTKISAILAFTSGGVSPELALDTVGREEGLVSPAETNQANQKSSGFRFGKASEAELMGVNSSLVAVVREALAISTQDFCVYDGIRTLKEQAQHVRNGTSKTMQSKHLQGLAVDLVPWHNGGPKWDWNLIWAIAFAMDEAATKLGFAGKIRWGGAWDRTLADFGGDPAAYKRECELYASRHPGKDFLDGPHFEWLA